MNKFTKLSMAIAVAAGVTMFAGAVSADYVSTLSRHGPTSPSGSGHTVAGECGGSFDGTDFPGQKAATGKVISEQAAGTTVTKITIKNARANTHYTVWLRMKGSAHGATIGGTPITGGGATPYAPSSELATLIDDWINPAGSLVPRANGFITNHLGNGGVTINSDFPVEGGSYPFNRMSAATLATAQGKRAAALAIPSPVVDPRQPNVSAPFLFRMVSHCQDDASHGVSPGNRETWFNYP